MAKQACATSKRFNEKKFIKYAENLQKELLVNAKQYLFDLEGHAKDPGVPECIGLSADCFESAINCAEDGLYLEAQANLSNAKHFYREIPEDIISKVMEAARYGGQRNFVKYLHTTNS